MKRFAQREVHYANAILANGSRRALGKVGALASEIAMAGEKLFCERYF